MANKKATVTISVKDVEPFKTIWKLLCAALDGNVFTRIKMIRELLAYAKWHRDKVPESQIEETIREEKPNG